MLTGRALIADIDACHPASGHAALWWLGQHSFIFKAGEAVVYIDPFLTPMAGRQIPPLLHPSEVTNATLIIGTHDHADHIDRPVWPALAAASPSARFICPAAVRAKVVRELAMDPARVLGADDGQVLQEAGVRLTAIAAAHELLDQDPATGQYPYLGFVIEAGGFTLYHSGDSCIYEGLSTKLRRWRHDVVLLPINGRDAKRLAAGCIGNMTYQEATDLAGVLAPRLTIPTHFDMFAGNSADPTLFTAYMRVKYPKLPALIPRHGERLDLPQ